MDQQQDTFSRGFFHVTSQVILDQRNIKMFLMFTFNNKKQGVLCNKGYLHSGQQLSTTVTSMIGYLHSGQQQSTTVTSMIGYLHYGQQQSTTVTSKI